MGSVSKQNLNLIGLLGIASLFGACRTGINTETANLMDVTGKFDLTGKSFQGGESCLEFRTNDEVAFQQGLEIRSGKYKWQPESRSMLLQLVKQQAGVPPIVFMEAQWKKNSTGTYVEVSLEGTLAVKLNEANCHVQFDEVVDPIPALGNGMKTGSQAKLSTETIPFREVFTSDLGNMKGAMEGPFFARNFDEWTAIYQSRISGKVDAQGKPISAPELTIDFSRNMVFGFQILDNTSGEQPEVTSIIRKGDAMFVTIVKVVAGPNCLPLTTTNAPAALAIIPKDSPTKVQIISREKFINCH